MQDDPYITPNVENIIHHHTNPRKKEEVKPLVDLLPTSSAVTLLMNRRRAWYWKVVFPKEEEFTIEAYPRQWSLKVPRETS